MQNIRKANMGVLELDLKIAIDIGDIKAFAVICDDHFVFPDILGDGDFVEEVLEKRCRQQFERRYRYTAQGYDFDWLAGQVAALLGLEQDTVRRPGSYPDTV
jgi:hypothetical protein